MTQKIDPHYNDFGGLDNRTNAMKQDSKSCRDGSQNFVFKTVAPNGDFDVLGKRRGLQHKTTSTYAAEMGLIEYSFKDISTGQQKTEILGVARDGKLRKRTRHRLKISRSGGTASTYSLFYDNSATAFRISFFNSSGTQLSTTTFSTSDSLDTVKSALTALSITGLTFDVVDDDGSTVTSSYKAYLLDVVSGFELIDGDNAYNEAFDWTIVQNPATDDVLFDYIASGNWQQNSEFEGITYVNIYNAVFITDGGWVIKYDGKHAYRAGMPKMPQKWTDTVNFSNISFGTAAGAGWDAGLHYFRLQSAYRDVNGALTLGKIQSLSLEYFLSGEDSGANNLTVGASGQVTVTMQKINDDKFPVYSCIVNGDQTISSTGSFNLAVDSGHNVEVGMALRVDWPNIAGPFSGQTNGGVTNQRTAYFEVTSTTATQITLQINEAFGGISIKDDSLFNACYVPSELYSKMVNAQLSLSPYIYGPFYILYATKSGADYTEPFYEVCVLPIPHSSGTSGYPIYTQVLDSAFGAAFDEETEAGEDLPRACRYLSKWQNQLIQAGRPWDETLADETYPTIAVTPSGSYDDLVDNVFYTKYTESHLCDFQSFYWNDPLYPEGFPQSGLNEDSVETVFSDQVKGISPNKDSFFVMKERGMALFSGTLATGEIIREVLETDIGCVAHNSIQEVQGALIWLDKVHGFVTCVAGRLPQPIGFAVQKQIKQNKFLSQTEALRLAGAKATNHRIDDVYICYIPGGTNDPDNESDVPYPNSNSLIFAFDYGLMSKGSRNCWYLWKGINAAGGILSTNDVLLASSLTDPNSGNQVTLKMKESGSIYDYSDHTSAISFVYNTAWLNYKDYQQDKHWIRIAVNSIVGNFDLTVKQYFNYITTSVGDFLLSFPSSGISPKLTMNANNTKALAYSLGFENNEIHEDVSINGFDLQYNAEFDQTEVVK